MLKSLAHRFQSARVTAKAACVAGLLLVGSPAMAQFVAPEMDPIVIPVDTASVVEVILLAGGGILLLVFGLWIGFSLAKKLMRRATSAV